ncbi:MAG: hypothetical protein ACU836_14030 [Gammaproteobacteria bacterium]
MKTKGIQQYGKRHAIGFAVMLFLLAVLEALLGIQLSNLLLN